MMPLKLILEKPQSVVQSKKSTKRPPPKSRPPPKRSPSMNQSPKTMTNKPPPPSEEDQKKMAMSSEAGTHGAPEESIEFDYSDEDEGKKDKKDQVMSQDKQKAETKARDEKDKSSVHLKMVITRVISSIKKARKRIPNQKMKKIQQ